MQTTISVGVQNGKAMGSSCRCWVKASKSFLPWLLLLQRMSTTGVLGRSSTPETPSRTRPSAGTSVSVDENERGKAAVSAVVERTRQLSDADAGSGGAAEDDGSASAQHDQGSSCGFLLPDGKSTVRCAIPYQNSCSDVLHLVSSCPASCPFVDQSQYFPCVAKCVAEEKCVAGSGLKGVEFADATTQTCNVCEVVGCVLCDNMSRKVCKECSEPAYKLASDGSCTYMLDANGFAYFSYFMFVAIAICLPHTLIKLFRPAGRPAIVKAAADHVKRCFPTVTRTVENPDGRAVVSSEVPSYCRTNMHRDYICGVGVPMYYNWLIFIGLWAVVGYGISGYVQHQSTLSNVPLFRDECPNLENLHGLNKYKPPVGTLAGPANVAAVAGTRTRSLRTEEAITSAAATASSRVNTVSSGLHVVPEFIGREKNPLQLPQPFELLDGRQERQLSSSEVAAAPSTTPSNEAGGMSILDTKQLLAAFSRDAGVSHGAQTGNFKVVELQRYEFAQLAEKASWILIVFTFLAVLLFACFQKREERMFDADNADMSDYCFIVEGLPTHVPLNLDEVTSFFQEKCGTSLASSRRNSPHSSGTTLSAPSRNLLIGTSLAHDYKEHRVLPKNGLSLDDICDKVLARADKKVLKTVYDAEREEFLSGQNSTGSASARELQITDYRFPWSWLYLQEFFLCFLTPTGKQLRDAVAQSKKQEIEVTTELSDHSSGLTTAVPQGSALLQPAGAPSLDLLAAQERDPEMRKYVSVGLVAPDFTEEQIEELREELRQMPSGGAVYCFCDYEKDVDVCVQRLQAEQRKVFERFSPAELEEIRLRSARSAAPPSAPSALSSAAATRKALEDAFPIMIFERHNVEPGDILWGNFDTSKSFYESWIGGPIRFVIQIVLYGLLMYAPAIVFILNSLQESANVPSGWAMTFLGILFSSGNGVVGLMFWYIAVALPFRYRRSQWLVVMISYSALFVLNTGFSVYIVFGQVFFGEKAEQRDKDALGEETYLGKQLYELLVPGTFLMPYLLWPLTGYVLRRLLRLYNSFIPFTDDVWSARIQEVRKAELHCEPPMVYLAWDYAVNFTLPLCCVLMSYLACPTFIHLLFWNLILWAVWMYFSQKYLHLMSSKLTFYTSARLSVVSLEMFAVIIGFLAGSIPWWQYRTEKFFNQLQIKLSHLTPEEEDKIADILAASRFPLDKFLGYFFTAAGLYLFLLRFAVRPRQVSHEMQAEGDGVHFRDVERKLGFNFENTNPVVTLKSHFCKEECQSILARRGGKSIMPFRVGKQYLHFSYDVDLMEGRMGDMWDMGQTAIAKGSSELHDRAGSMVEMFESVPKFNLMNFRAS
ncbi:unnamed protein product [Amoebophrya sp. A120]|nr:unnamed protein product [Amoebophrya sp. A120]|eukprot:GSA120T00023019001.1